MNTKSSKPKVDRHRDLFQITKEVVVGRVTHGGTDNPITAAFKIIGEDYSNEHDVNPNEVTTYRFPGPNGGIMAVDVEEQLRVEGGTDAD
jgi:hypothetical protein